MKITENENKCGIDVQTSPYSPPIFFERHEARKALKDLAKIITKWDAAEQSNAADPNGVCVCCSTAITIDVSTGVCNNCGKPRR